MKMNLIKKSKKFKMLFWGVISFVLLSPVFVYGTESTNGTSGSALTTLENPLAVNTPMALVASLTTAVAKIGVPIATVFIIYSGLLFVMARGNDEKLRDARKTFMWAILGTGILLGAWVIGSAIGSTICSVGGGTWAGGRCN